MEESAVYLDRIHAGELLAKKLTDYAGQNVVVLALPRGGVVLGAEVAKELEAPLGVVLVRKIGHPSNPEYAIGAVAEGQRPLFNSTEIASISKTWLNQAIKSARDLMARRKDLYYGEELTPPTISGKTVIVVDDGIATGLTMHAAIMSLRSSGATRIIVAVPVAPQECITLLEEVADELIVLSEPETFRGAVGSHYQHFEEVSDDEVASLLWEVNHDIPVNTTAPSRNP